MHIGRHWPSTYLARARGTEQHPTLEERCPCPKEPCGLVDQNKVHPDCEHHPFSAAKTLRASHEADACPGKPSEA